MEILLLMDVPCREAEAWAQCRRLATASGQLGIHHQLLPAGVVGGVSLEEPEAGLMPSLASLDHQPGCWHHKMPCVLLPVLAALCCLQCSLGSTGSSRQLHAVKLCVCIYFFPFKGLHFPLPREAIGCAATPTGCVCAAWSCPDCLAELRSLLAQTPFPLPLPTTSSCLS